MTRNKRIPHDDLYLFKSCVTGSLYPGIEISVRYVLDRLGITYVDDPCHSSCAGFGYHAGFIPLRTNLALNARNFALAAESPCKNIVCTCPTSYGNLRECQAMIEHDGALKEQTDAVLAGAGRKYVPPSSISHISEVFLGRLGEIAAKAVLPMAGIKAVTHHGCHYSKIFYEDVSAGDFERPVVLDNLASGLGCEIVEYSERSLCCGMGFHHTVLDREYPKAVLKRKFGSILEASPDVILTQCPGCTFNLDYYQESVAGSSVPVLYFSELIALALGARPADIGLDMHAVPVEPLLEKLGVKP
ncbi:CoB--CoM heterodisulfide reductase iron-sulfur subunit B family protein [Methanocella sp. MCL-LM]|uniref:CoB--CoM heterodisulfide reductase iron-sulfur subunit B family protein n=1 Tax=Methanocella sp. MCL-LM TaxID=3412035 RepID=UPI003C7587E6